MAIVDGITERLPPERPARITRVDLRIGALAAVDSSALKFAWSLATEGTPASMSELRITHVPLTILCANCDAERTIERGALPVCPRCGESSNDITGGRELEIVAMEVVDDPADHRSSAIHS